MKASLQVDGVDVFIEGEGAPSIVMIHGWPDTYRVWDAQVAAFKSSYRCIRFTLPGFDIDKPRRAYSLDEMMHTFANIVQTSCPDKKVILMVHDWGASFGYQFAVRYPELVSRLIGVDIGDASSPEFLQSMTLKAKLMVEAYQGWLSLTWQVGGPVGDCMAKFLARAMKCRSDPRYISSGMSYPYFIKRTFAHGSYQDMRPVEPRCPMLFIYGKKKLFMFHSQQWVDKLASQPGSKVVGMDTDHWPMRSDPDTFNREVLSFLTATASPTASA